MANIIIWTIESMQVSTQTINGFSQVVLDASWRCTGTDTQTPPNVATVYGSCSFPEPQVDGAFTPYDQLTQQQVLGWVWTSGEVNQAETEANINAQLSNLVNPPVVNPPLPW